MANKTQRTAKTVVSPKKANNKTKVETVSKDALYLDFLTDLWNLSKKDGDFVFTPIIKKHGVSPKVMKAILAGDWVKKVSGSKYRWVAGKPNKSTVRVVLDCFDIDKKAPAKEGSMEELLNTINDEIGALADSMKITDTEDDLRLDRLVESLNGSLNEVLAPIFQNSLVENVEREVDENKIETDRKAMDALLDELHKLQSDYTALQTKFLNPSTKIDELVAHHNRFNTREDQLVILSMPLFEDLNNQLLGAQHDVFALTSVLESSETNHTISKATQEAVITELTAKLETANLVLEDSHAENLALNAAVTKLDKGLEQIKNMSLFKLKTFFSPKWFEDIFK